jgi:PAS domain S-box-containing protein
VNKILAHPLRMIGGIGSAVAIVLAILLALLLWNDRGSRLNAAQRQSMAIATGTDRLLRSELTTFDRILRGTANDARDYFWLAPSEAPALLDSAIAGVLARNPDLAAITLVDGEGQPLSAGAGDPTFKSWVNPAHRVLRGELYLGKLERGPGGSRLVHMAIPVQPGRWLLARVRLAAFQQIVTGLDTGRLGVVSIGNRDGQLLAHSLDPSLVERALPRPMRMFPADDKVSPRGVADSPVDGLPRIGAISAPRDYPLIVFSGLSYKEVMGPWYAALYAAIGLYVLYLIGLLYLIQLRRRSLQRQARHTEELRAGAAELAMAHQVGKVGTWSISSDGSTLRWSAQTQQLFGLSTRQSTLPALYARVHPEDCPALKAELQQALDSGGVVNSLFRLRLRDGSTRWLSARGEMVSDHRRRRMTGAVVDVTERVHSQLRAQEAERQFRLVFDRNPAPFWIFDIHTLQFLEVNQAAVQQYGYSREEFLGMTVLDIHAPEYHEEITRFIQQLTDGQNPAERVFIHRRKDGSSVEVIGHSARLEFDGRPALLVLAEDASQRLAYERDLAYRASHHPGTGLLTVRALSERLDAGSSDYTIVHVQLRGLQMVADTLGNDAGEEVLQAMAARLGSLAASWGMLAYQPAEDFVLAIAAGHDVQQVLDTLLKAVSEPVRGRDSRHQLEPRLGVASCPADGELAEQVLGRAAQAAHAARESGAVMARFDASIAARFTERLQLAGRIHTAIDQGEFELHFQSIHHAADRSPAALEALLRWPQADGSFIPPSDFIRLCEDTGLIVALGRWVIHAAARAQRQLADRGWGAVPIAVNISAVQLFNSDLVDEFSRATEAWGLPAGALQLELTESAVMRNPAQALQTLQALRGNGIGAALDDFGTGFSSMSYLQHLPLDSLKIDRDFVSDVERNPRNAAICRALLSLGHSMGLNVIAEGVETEGQLAWLAAHGCDQVQGWLLGRPMPLEALLAVLDEGRRSV